MSSCDLRLGAWQQALSDVEEVDLVATDPPYSERCHDGQTHERARGEADHLVSAKGLDYDHLTPADVSDFVDGWAPRNRGWFTILTDHVLVPNWEEAFARHDLVTFAPLPCVLRGMNVRLQGDGPSSWSIQLVVARPKSLAKWGTLPGAYVGTPFDADGSRPLISGGKPLWLMQAIIRDYSRPGDLVCDPFAGSGTTLVAALSEGRRAIGAEVDPNTHTLASARLRGGYTPSLFAADGGSR